MINWNNDILKVNILLCNKIVNNIYFCIFYIYFGVNLRLVVKICVVFVINWK